MCGIVGMVGGQPVAGEILESLRRLEYRGYDSAGIATLIDGRIERRRAAGKLVHLAQMLDRSPLLGSTGIGHTRWATHGAPTEGNAHPHSTSRVSLVHNGIIENHATLRAELEAEGQAFSTDTDTEVIVQLIDLNLQRGMAPTEATAAALRRLEGAYALAMIFSGQPDMIVGAKSGTPLAVGFSADVMSIGSDIMALSPTAERVAYLRDGDWTVIGRDGAAFFDREGRQIEREMKSVRKGATVVGKGPFRHFMLKELHEHPVVVGNTLRRLTDISTASVVLPALPFDLADVSRVTVSACGSAYYAGAVGRFWFESIARVPTDIDVASEFRYRSPPMEAGGLGLLVSQSGETADTLAALRYMRSQEQHVVSVLNVPESSIARESDVVIETDAGPEIGVASTKAFTAQLVALACLVLATARARGTITVEAESSMVRALYGLPALMAQVLLLDDAIGALAQSIVAARDVLFLGRGACFPIAMEGALKLKEISYIHAEGYAAGEMKHGPIALIDPSVPVVAVAPSGPLFDKLASNLQEAAARGGRIVVFSDLAGSARLAEIATSTIVLPTVDAFVAPILYAVAVQMLAYHVAVLKGTDVDQPRNLAKSVTVE
jgi:glucosamine--fructose-6-phosphate aminotransferase (isomerizing)